MTQDQWLVIVGSQADGGLLYTAVGNTTFTLKAGEVMEQDIDMAC